MLHKIKLDGDLLLSSHKISSFYKEVSKIKREERIRFIKENNLVSHIGKRKFKTNDDLKLRILLNN